MQVPPFQRERSCRLRLEVEGGAASPATTDDIIQAARCCALRERERIAREIWPDVFDRLRAAESLIDQFSDARVMVKRLDDHLEKYPPPDEEIPF